MRTALRSAAIVDAWFDTLMPEQREMAEALRDLVLQAEPKLAVSVKWGNLMFTWFGTHAMGISLHRSHAQLQVFNGARIAHDFPRLEGTARGMRSLKFRYHQSPDTAMVRAVTHACVTALAEGPDSRYSTQDD